MGPSPAQRVRAPSEDGAARAPTLAELICAARAGSQAALGELLDTCRKYLLTVANRDLDSDIRGKVGASDLVQDTFVEAQRDFEHFAGTTEGELLGWLTAILENRLANNVRYFRHTQKRTIDRELPGAVRDAVLAHLGDPQPTPATAAASSDEERRLRLAIERLPQRQRELIVLRSWQRVSFAEIGVLVGCSGEGARKQWARAVRQLQRLLNSTR